MFFEQLLAILLQSAGDSGHSLPGDSVVGTVCRETVGTVCRETVGTVCRETVGTVCRETEICPCTGGISSTQWNLNWRLWERGVHEGAGHSGGKKVSCRTYTFQPRVTLGEILHHSNLVSL